MEKTEFKKRDIITEVTKKVMLIKTKNACED